MSEDEKKAGWSRRDEWWVGKEFTVNFFDDARTPSDNPPSDKVLNESPADLRPTLEHANKPYHWLRCCANHAEIWGWNGIGWDTMLQAKMASPTELKALGYHYLGPAEWRQPEAFPLADGFTHLQNECHRLQAAIDGPRGHKVREGELLREIATLRRHISLPMSLILRVDDIDWVLADLHPSVADKIRAHLPTARSLIVKQDPACVAGLAAANARIAELERALRNSVPAPLRADGGLAKAFFTEDAGPYLRFSAPAGKTLYCMSDVKPLEPKPTEVESWDIFNAWSAILPGDLRLPAPIAPTSAEERGTDPVGPNDEVHRRVEEVLGDIAAGRVVKPARKALRDAVDKADAPLTGKPAADAGLGRAITRLKGRGWV